MSLNEETTPSKVQEPESPQERKDGSAVDGSSNKTPQSLTKKRLLGLTDRTKAKTKQLFGIDGAALDDESESEDDGVFDPIEHDPAFQMSSLVKKKRFRPSKTADKTKNNIKSLGRAIVHPVDSIKSKATRTTAGQLSKADRPFLSQDADKKYLEAHDDLKRAESTTSSIQGTSDEEQESIVGGHREKLKEIENHREGLRVAWTTSRHVRRVRVVPKRHIGFPSFPKEDDFTEKDAPWYSRRYDWLKWLGHALLYYTQDFAGQYVDDFDELPFDIDSTRHYAERLVMASAPWQSWAVNVRAVYRWEHPPTTAKWLALYLVLWFTQHIMGFLYCYIIYIVLKNRYFPTAVGSIRESMQKTLDNEGTASRFSELIDRHGSHDWLEPVMNDVGPHIQLQVGDIANILEVFSNFYHWKNPNKTAATLSFITSCLLISIFADMAFCMNIVWFIVGATFFVCWPISSLYPKYRYLVSPIKWALWEIPTHSEWSFLYLRRQAQVTRERMIQKKVEEGHFREVANPTMDEYTGRMTAVPKIRIEGGDTPATDNNDGDSDDSWHSTSSSTSVLEASDVRSFRTYSHGIVGRLVVFTKGIRYVRSLPKKEIWRLDFLEIAEMQKVQGSNVSKLGSLSTDQLDIVCVDGGAFHLEGMKERDEAFNTIIAFSSLQWQSLQIKGVSNDSK